MSWIERFAPSPTGPLHLGHAFSALTAWQNCVENNGKFLLRIEDIDPSRSRADYEQGIYDDLTWLGITWQKPVLRQSDNLAAYRKNLNKLSDLGLTYACTCSRTDIKKAAPNGHIGPDGLVYPGTCQKKNHPYAKANIRLNMAKAISYLGGDNAVNDLFFIDKNTKTHLNALNLRAISGDIVLSRKSMATTYHMAVVTDDASQNITNVTRGMDLFEATQIHRLLQALLNLPTPTYHHHHLITDDTGKRLAKRADSRAISKFRADGATPNDIRVMIGL